MTAADAVAKAAEHRGAGTAPRGAQPIDDEGTDEYASTR
jgi:hypothetical protein